MAKTDYAEVRQRVAMVQHNLQQQTEAIRENRSYSPEGKKQELAKAMLAARQQIQQLRAEHEAHRVTRRESLQRSLFGLPRDATPHDIAIWRDAQDRAETIKSGETAREKMDRARISGDKTMVRAIAQKAYESGWTEVTNLFADKGTGEEYGFDEYMLQQLNDIPAGPNTAMADSAIFKLEAPAELASAMSGTADATDGHLLAIAHGTSDPSAVGSSRATGESGTGSFTGSRPSSSKPHVAERLREIYERSTLQTSDATADAG